ncbi:GIY-YIG nuclease family protein [Aequorivita capsosiphonis]|uniref:GIY-YIG nuclease family protein n=1 Tax=Aequorivita capsosiphonis TaxID=487317 RepID=UPI0004217DBF|nr:GIY-YIG nuclease family protein [Aequorivita capsosiphonis]
MKYSYISIFASSNNISNARMLQIAIINTDESGIYSKVSYYIKPVPRIPKRDLAYLEIDSIALKSANVFCDIAPLIIEKIIETKTIFSDKFSEKLFIKAFKEIGYPVGNASYVLEKLFKQLVSGRIPFSLKTAQISLGLSMETSSLLEKCEVMKAIFEVIPEIETVNIKRPPVNTANSFLESSLKLLPNSPGVYFFRNNSGEIIYVGKAINISKRVRSHFTSSVPFETKLCSQTFEVDYEETGTELIALLLESHYIGSLHPQYNSQQKELLKPFIITSKMDSKGVLRLRPLQKNYKDSENEFYYNRDSVIKKLIEVQQKFKLCRKFAGIERTKASCSDSIFCEGICKDLESNNDYNKKVEASLAYLEGQRPSYILKLKGRHKFEMGFVIVNHGIYTGFGFIDSDTQINSFNDISGYLKHYTHTYFTSRILDQFHKTNRRASDNILTLHSLRD